MALRRALCRGRADRLAESDVGTGADAANGGIEVDVAALVLLGAVLHAAWNAIIKVQGDRVVGMALITVAGTVAGAAVLPFVPPPDAASWPYLAAALACHFGYYLALARAYGIGDFSQVYPIARGVTPMLVAVGAFAVAGERIATLAALGMILVTAGIAVLAYIPGRQVDWRAVLAALATAAWVAVSSIIDGMGVRRAGEPLSYLAWLFVLDGGAIVALCLWRYGGRDLVRRARPIAAYGLLGGLMAVASYGLAVWAMASAPMGLVVALRETSVVFGAAIGALVFREAFGARRIAAAIGVAAGIALIKLAG